MVKQRGKVVKVFVPFIRFQTFGYDFNAIKPVLEEIGALEKATKLNTGFIDRLVNGHGLDEEKREILKNARQELTETRNIQVIKNNK